MKNDQRAMSRNLFFETDLTQGQIADLVGIAQKTVSFWANEENWKRLKRLAKETPALVAENMFSEVCRLNEAIMSREPGKQYATFTESEIRRKTLVSIRYVKEHDLPMTNVTVLTNFMGYLRKQPDLDAAKLLTKYAVEYLNYEGIAPPRPDNFDNYTFRVPPVEPEPATPGSFAPDLRQPPEPPKQSATKPEPLPSDEKKPGALDSSATWPKENFNALTLNDQRALGRWMEFMQTFRRHLSDSGPQQPPEPDFG